MQNCIGKVSAPDLGATRPGRRPDSGTLRRFRTKNPMLFLNEGRSLVQKGVSLIEGKDVK